MGKLEQACPRLSSDWVMDHHASHCDLRRKERGPFCISPICLLDLASLRSVGYTVLLLMLTAGDGVAAADADVGAVTCDVRMLKQSGCQLHCSWC